MHTKLKPLHIDAFSVSSPVHSAPYITEGGVEADSGGIMHAWRCHSWQQMRLYQKIKATADFLSSVLKNERDDAAYMYEE
ncbi:hypothetical protein C2845_PM06G03650 [Panicum miliaceum]|uniref:Uncharacterized protein n=1 Tax=Panicum miliaceum TaxID=4540 RepID=A0A3L6R812_PANMI|nr:hypothetical protein C2845_PM06G03650 [Panicum miliaceum]